MTTWRALVVVGALVAVLLDAYVGVVVAAVAEHDARPPPSSSPSPPPPPTTPPPPVDAAQLAAVRAATLASVLRHFLRPSPRRHAMPTPAQRPDADADADADDNEVGVVVAHVGCRDGRLTENLRTLGLLMHGVEYDPAQEYENDVWPAAQRERYTGTRNWAAGDALVGSVPSTIDALLVSGAERALDESKSERGGRVVAALAALRAPRVVFDARAVDTQRTQRDTLLVVDDEAATDGADAGAATKHAGAEHTSADAAADAVADAAADDVAAARRWIGVAHWASLWARHGYAIDFVATASAQATLLTAMARVDARAFAEHWSTVHDTLVFVRADDVDTQQRLDALAFSMRRLGAHSPTDATAASRVASQRGELVALLAAEIAARVRSEHERRRRLVAAIEQKRISQQRRGVW